MFRGVAETQHEGHAVESDSQYPHVHKASLAQRWPANSVFWQLIDTGNKICRQFRNHSMTLKTINIQI